MSRDPIVARSLAALRETLKTFGAAKETVALVPTMGALHEGHLALVREARRRCQRVAVSIFVNPTQFAPHEDFDSYPRTWDTDLAKLAAEKIDLIWNPDVKTMYPSGFASRIVTDGPAIVDLEDRFRPHFFGGVTTVVGKLFIQCRPDVAVFGEKDYQQLRVVTQMARDLDLGVDVVGLATVRESDGLAMSSRNVYLSQEERTVAPVLHYTMQDTAAALRAGNDMAAALAAGAARISKAGFALDYFEARHAETLQPIMSLKDGPVRLLVAAKIGTTRLIDNIGV
jgi:pantoate--beta-alanine ligase